MNNILSVYDGFFVGGSRIVHTNTISHLHTNYLQNHSVLSLTNKVKREYSVQLAEETPSWLALKSSGINPVALDRTPENNWSENDVHTIQEQIDNADLIFSLKEQPLVGLSKTRIDKPLVVSLHRSDPENQGKGTQDLYTAWKEGVVSKIICCAERAKEAYVDIGFDPNIIEVIHNGVDLERFYFDKSKRKMIRKDLGIPTDAPVVAIAARFDGMKNIPLFIEAAEKFLSRNPDAHVIACGTGMTKDNKAFQKLLHNVSFGVQTRIHALGIVKNIEHVYNATDLIVLSSTFGEAAPLCLLEGMASGAVPVTTDVGDSAMMVRDSRLVVDGFDPDNMCKTWENAFSDLNEHKRTILGFRDELSDKKMFEKFHDALEKHL